MPATTKRKPAPSRPPRPVTVKDIDYHEGRYKVCLSNGTNLIVPNIEHLMFDKPAIYLPITGLRYPDARSKATRFKLTKQTIKEAKALAEMGLPPTPAEPETDPELPPPPTPRPRAGRSKPPPPQPKPGPKPKPLPRPKQPVPTATAKPALKPKPKPLRRTK